MIKLSKVSARFSKLLCTFLLLALATTVCACRASAAEKIKKTPRLDLKQIKKLAGETWAGIYASGKKVGYLKSDISFTIQDGRKVMKAKSEATIKMKYGQVEATVSSKSMQVYDLKNEAILLNTSTTSLNGQLLTSVVVKPKDKGYEIASTFSGKQFTRTLPACKNGLRAALGPQLLAFSPNPKLGDSISGEILMPEIPALVRTEHKIIRKENLLFRGVATDVYVISSTLYPLAPAATTDPENKAEKTPPAALARLNLKVDSEGRMLEGTIMGTFTFRLESKKNAKRFDRIANILSASGIRPDRQIRNSRKAIKASLLITGLPKGTGSDDSRQKFERKADGSCLLTLTAGQAPESCKALTPKQREKHAQHLKATPLIQSQHPDIMALAKKIVAGEKDPFKASAKICAWVFANTRKIFTPAISNALDTLRTRKGDCGEHAVLFVALCRAAGIPAREVAGLAYESRAHLFGGHAWAEIFVENRWLAVDPTFGQSIADAIHIKIAEGGMEGIEGFIRLGSLLGSIKIKVLSVENKAATDK
jgi:Transglutaminase-like superfamily